MKRIRPSPSYSIEVPEGIREEQDERVTSIWISDSAVLLQLSSYLRSEGEQVTAQSRLRQRMKNSPADWRMLSEQLHADSSVDQAAAECLDERRVLWIHTYLVWPHLSIYALISGPESEIRDPANWARTTLKSIELAVH